MREMRSGVMYLRMCNLMASLFSSRERGLSVVVVKYERISSLMASVYTFKETIPVLRFRVNQCSPAQN